MEALSQSKKAIPPVSTKITRKLASESSDHKDVMNYYSSISRDETGAPVRWKMSSVHEEVLPGRGSPALAKVARSRSNSRDSSLERKKVGQETQNKVSSGSKKTLVKKSQENVTSVELGSTEELDSIDCIDTSTVDFVSEKEKSETPDEVPIKKTEVRKRGRPKSEPFSGSKKLLKLKSKQVGSKVKGIIKSDSVVKRKRGRPKSLDLKATESTDHVMNGDDEFFKSPHPLTPCNILVKPKKGRPKETPPTLEPEPSLSPNTHLNGDSYAKEENEKKEYVRRAGPGRPPKKKHLILQQKSYPLGDEKKITKGRPPKNKLIDGNKKVMKRKTVLPLKTKNIHFKRNGKVTVRKLGKSQKVNPLIPTERRKGGRPPGSKNKPKPVAHLILDSKMRRSSLENENKPDRGEEMILMPCSVEMTKTENVSASTDIPITEIVAENNSFTLTSIVATSSQNESVAGRKLTVKHHKDSFHKTLIRNSKVNPKSKAMKESKSVPKVKRKRIMASHAKKYTDSAIASLPVNDLRRKLHEKLLLKLSSKSKPIVEQIEKELDEPTSEDDLNLLELKKQSNQPAELGSNLTTTYGIQQLKSSPEVQNLSAMVEAKRYTKSEKDPNLSHVRKKGRPKKIIPEMGKVSDTESTCSEISSFSSLSASSSIRKHYLNAEVTVKPEDNSLCGDAKIRKKPGRKRKREFMEEIKDQTAKKEKSLKSDIVYDFEANSEFNKSTSSGVGLVRKRGRPKLQKSDDGNIKSKGRSVLNKTIKLAVRGPRSKEVFKHLNKVKMARGIKSKSTRAEFKSLKRKAQYSSYETNIESIESAKQMNIPEIEGKLETESDETWQIGNSLVTNVSFRGALKSDDGLSVNDSEVKINNVKSYINTTNNQEIAPANTYACINGKTDKETKFINTDKETDQMKLNSFMLQSPVDKKYVDLLTSPESDHEVCKEVNLNSVDNKASGHYTFSECFENTNKLDSEVKTADMILKHADSWQHYKGHETGNGMDQKDNEIISCEFNKSIIDKAKEISFEVNEKKRLLKEKILKGREFNKSFISKAEESRLDEEEVLLPDKDVDEKVQSNVTNYKLKEISFRMAADRNRFSITEVTDTNVNEMENSDSPDEIVKAILNSMIDQICGPFTLTSDHKEEKRFSDNIGLTAVSSSVDEKNIREFLGNIPDSVQCMKTLNLKFDKTVTENDFHSQSFKIRKPISNIDLMKRHKRLRKREKKSAKADNTTVRKIELRQKISRSPLDNIALKQSIEENEYMKQQWQKTLKRGQKTKLKESPILVQSQPLLQEQGESTSVSEQNSKPENNKDKIETSHLMEEINAFQKVGSEDLSKECKPCSVILKDFLKELQLKSSLDSMQGLEGSPQRHEVEETVKNKSDNSDNTEKAFESDHVENYAIMQQNKDENFADSRVCEQTDSTKGSADKTEEQYLSKTLLQMSENQTTEHKGQKHAHESSIEETNSKDLIKQSKKQYGQHKRQMMASDRKDNEGGKKRGRKPFKRLGQNVGQKGPPKTLRKRVVKEMSQKPKLAVNKVRATKSKQGSQLLLENKDKKVKQKISLFDTNEQTARKTVPPLKIKLQGGLTSKTKVYTIEAAVDANPSSVDSALDSKPKKKFKSKSKSDSESEKHKSSNHSTRKLNKSPESDRLKNIEKKMEELHKADILKANDPYEANFLAFIQQKEKAETVNITNWRSSVIAKTSHQLVGGKACKSGADGTFTVSACASADTKTSSVGLDKFVTVSKSPASSATENPVETVLTEHFSKSASSEHSEKVRTTDLDHFQQTEKAVNNLVSKASSNKQYICNHCEFLCESQNEIMEHTKSLHKDQLLYSCSVCQKVTFKTKLAILEHFATVHEGMKDAYICLPDYYEKQTETKAVKSPLHQPDNIFDRINNLLDKHSSGSSKPVTNPVAETVEARKTAVEADSTTTALDESDTPSSISATSVEREEEAEATTLAADQSIKDVPKESTAVQERETAEKDDGNENTDNELNIKIVDVVSLKDQVEFNSECSVASKSSENVYVNNVSSSKTIKHSELKVPFYPISQVAKSLPVVVTTAPQTVTQVRKQQVKTGTTYKCETCQVHAPVLAALVAHLKNSHSNIPKLFQCPYCRDMEGESEALIHQHIRQSHPTDNPNPPVALSEPAKRNLKTLTVELPEKAEGTNIERDIYMCLRCKKHLPSLEMIYNHLELEHRDVFVYVCPFCKVFKSKEEIVVNSHVSSVHGRDVDDINTSLAIDGTQFVRVCSLIKDKGVRTGPRPLPSPSQLNKTQAEPRISPRQPAGSLTIPFHQNMAPLNPNIASLNPALRPNTSQTVQNLNAQQPVAVRPPQLQGAKKRKATLSESIAHLTMQRQLQQAQQEANKVQPNNDTNQLSARPSVQQPPPLLRGPPPLIRYDQLTKVPASLVAAQQFLQSGKTSIAPNDQAVPKVTSNILGQLTISAAERLQTLNNPKSYQNQVNVPPKPIQSALFDTSDPNAFLPVNRRQPGPVLNIPQIPRAANRPPSQQDSPVMQRNLITGSPLDLSNKSTPEPSPPADSKADDTNPEAFKIFNLQPTAPVHQSPANIVPQFVRPDTTSTLAYRPTTPHVANMPVSAVNMVPISLGNVSLQQMQNLPQFVRMNFPQALHQVVAPQTLQQVVISQSLQQVVVPHSLNKVVAPQSVQQIIIPQSLQQVIASSPVTHVTSKPQTAVMASSKSQTSTSEASKDKEVQPAVNYKCPYCPQIVKLTVDEVKPHIEAKHPGSQVIRMPLQ